MYILPLGLQNTRPWIRHCQMSSTLFDFTNDVWLIIKYMNYFEDRNYGNKSFRFISITSLITIIMNLWHLHISLNVVFKKLVQTYRWHLLELLLDRRQFLFFVGDMKQFVLHHQGFKTVFQIIHVSLIRRISVDQNMSFLEYFAICSSDSYWHGS